MTAYVIAEVEVTDQVAFAAYRNQVPATLQQYAGEYIIRGAETETVEGSWEPKRLVVIKFPTMDQAKKWYNSEEYSAAMKLRKLSAKANVLFVEGV